MYTEMLKFSAECPNYGWSDREYIQGGPKNWHTFLCPL